MSNFMSHVPVIYAEKCNGCGLCVSVCCCEALVVVNNTITIIETGMECDWCTQCEAVCPAGAICCPYEIVVSQS